MSQRYNVVFEYTQEVAGYAGIRFVVPYSNEANYTRIASRLNKRTNTLAHGVTVEEAQNMTALTPEICRLTAAIDDICHSKDGHIDQRLANYYLESAISEIEEDRQHCQKNNLNKSVTDFSFVNFLGQEDTEKRLLYQYVNNRFYKSNGNLSEDLESVNRMIKNKINKIIELRS